MSLATSLTTSLKDNASDSLVAIDPLSKKPSLVKRFKTQVRRRFSQRDKRYASLNSPSSSSIPIASSIFASESVSSTVKNPTDVLKPIEVTDNYRHAASDTTSTSSTIVADADLPKPTLLSASWVDAEVDVSQPVGLEESMSLSKMEMKEEADVDVLEIRDGHQPTALITEAQNTALPPSPSLAAKALDSSLSMLSDVPPSQSDNTSHFHLSPIEKIPLDVLDPHNSSPPSLDKPPATASPATPGDERGSPNILVTGLAALIMCIPLPHIRLEIRVLPLSFVVLWYLCRG